MLLATSTVAAAPTTVHYTAEETTFKALNAPINDVSGLSEEMYRIAKCESGLRQFDSNGNVLRGRVNPKDVGLFQINEFYHLETSQKLGHDIYTLEGNIGYALWLVENQGYKPWIHSNPCHRLLG